MYNMSTEQEKLESSLRKLLALAKTDSLNNNVKFDLLTAIDEVNTISKRIARLAKKQIKLI